MDDAAIDKLNDLQGIYIVPEHAAGFLIDSVLTLIPNCGMNFAVAKLL
jgi:hypothetical protein